MRYWRMTLSFEFVKQARDYLLDRMGAAPEIAIIMGSGLSAIDEILSAPAPIPYASVPHFPIPKVAGHRAQMVFGKAGGLPIVLFEGRIHYYEGHTMADVTFYTRVIGSLGVHTLLLTNAAGAVNPSFERGRLMIITDHINLMGANPLLGPNDDRWGVRFVDQTEVYDLQLRNRLKEAGRRCGVPLVEGVYAAMSGPTYETPAEVRYLRTMGADAVGMSTVPETIVARHMGMKVAGLSMLANAAAGISGKAITHDEVLEVAAKASVDLGKLLQSFFEIYGS